jgi:hypothetical protein
LDGRDDDLVLLVGGHAPQQQVDGLVVEDVRNVQDALARLLVYDERFSALGKDEKLVGLQELTHDDAIVADVGDDDVLGEKALNRRVFAVAAAVEPSWL